MASKLALGFHCLSTPLPIILSLTTILVFPRLACPREIKKIQLRPWQVIIIVPSFFRSRR